MTGDPGVAVRRTALDALVRIDDGGAYANLVLGPVLSASGLDERDRRFATDLVYGTTRMRRACQHLVERHRRGGVTPRVASVLRLGAYQLAFAGVAPHAAVASTVGAAPKAARGLVNAVLRRVAADVAAGIDWPDEATRLSYPDWIVAALRRRLGPEVAGAALQAMNRPATTHVREDGYVQDLASQAVVEAVAAGPGVRVLDVCAAPGGKATGLAAAGADVVAGDRTWGRAALVAANAARTGHALAVVVADGTAPPHRRASFDRVLVDAPCSGLGVLRRRADARWRVDAAAPARLAELQVRLLEEAAPLVAPGGTLVFSVCTLTVEENAGVAGRARLGDLELVGEQTIVPDDASDGMYVARWARS